MKHNTVADISEENLYISGTNLNLHQFPNYKITMMYFILVELFFIKYNLYKKNKRISQGKGL